MVVRRNTTKKTRESLYAASRYLSKEVERELGVMIPFDVYSQDPKVAKDDEEFAFENDFYVRWEPGLTDGPTSSRFAVVDFNGDTGHLAPKAVWSSDDEAFADPHDYILDRANVEPLQFHQVNVWALLQRALEFFEAGTGLGRRIPFGFEGNRLIVVPHAGYGQNAFYDRTSKSLQFYYFDDDDERIYTCLSADIVNHEFGHAVLDGVRPYFMESVGVETGAFHEFIGDLSAILILLRNNDFRRKLAKTTGGDLGAADHLKHIAQQFGEAISNVPYLRTAANDMKMSDIKPEHGPHRVSEILTGTMFDILKDLSDHYLKRENERYRQRVREIDSRTDLTEAAREKEKKKRLPSAKTAFWNAIQRMQCMAIQPLDLLPPVDVTFRDYALAVLRADSLANPMDPRGHRARARDRPRRRRRNGPPPRPPTRAGRPPLSPRAPPGCRVDSPAGARRSVRRAPRCLAPRACGAPGARRPGAPLPHEFASVACAARGRRSRATSSAPPRVARSARRRD